MWCLFVCLFLQYIVWWKIHEYLYILKSDQPILELDFSLLLLEEFNTSQTAKVVPWPRSSIITIPTLYHARDHKPGLGRSGEEPVLENTAWKRKPKHAGQPREKARIGAMGRASTQLNHFSMAGGNCTLFLCRITGSYYGGGSLPNSKNYVNHQGRHQVWRVPPGIFWTFFRAFLGLSHCFHWQFCFFFFLQSPRLHWNFNPQPSYQTSPCGRHIEVI